MGDYWTNESVLAFAGSRDPLEAVEEAARTAVFEAVEAGWKGPPFDPFELARLRDVEVIPRNELREARTVPADGGVAIEYNPTRPRDRVRFSIAHEIAHTLFGDVTREPRYRHNPSAGPTDGWQLEMLCNVAAAEILMPTEVLGEHARKPMRIEELMALRATFGVSTEALLRRATKLANYPVAMFAAARTHPDALDSSFRIDYTVPSLAWGPKIRRGTELPGESVLAACTAVGFTARGEEDWPDSPRGLSVQAVGTPPYPGQRLPRVLGWLRPKGVSRVKRIQIDERHGDATRPHGSGERMIVHLVNDRTANWGGQFARALSQRHPQSQDDFRSWVDEDSARLHLGATRIVRMGGGLSVASVVAQKGYGPSKKARIRYSALRDALSAVASTAAETGASLHMPRIGAGQAGGRWPLVREIIEETVIRAGVPVTVYVPPSQEIADDPEPYTELRLNV
ncbi:MAG: ImmA/IrrE family metallo-endopeptidase [Actinobacteria bacterium]|nr:ImmA/IrrE family metallo-endopeptidase [Actinomycetota bacterium]